MSGTLRSRRRAIPANLLSAAVPRPTANVLLGLATPSTGSGFLTPRSAARPFSPLTPRLIPRTPLPQATALPTPIQLAFTTLYTTTRVVTETLTTVYPDAPTDAPMPTGMPVGMPAEAPAPAPAAPGPEGPAAGAAAGIEGVAAAPNATGAAVPAAVPTLDVAGGQGAAAATDGGSVATIGAPGGNMSLVIGISGAASLSLLGVAGFFIARRRRMMGANMKLNRNNETKIKPSSRDSLDALRVQAIAGQVARPYSSRYWLQ